MVCIIQTEVTYWRVTQFVWYRAGSHSVEAHDLYDTDGVHTAENYMFFVVRIAAAA